MRPPFHPSHLLRFTVPRPLYPRATAGFLLAMGISLALSSAPSTLAAEPVWTVRMFAQGEESRLSVESETLYVDLLEQHAWTIRNIRFDGEEIVGEHGANGSVTRVTREADNPEQDPWIGTGHGKEVVHSLTILIDGQKHSYKPGSVVSGDEIVIRKSSNMGPFDHETEVAFPATGDRIVERHAYKVVEDLSRRFDIVYAFMHCNSNSLDQWLALTAEGEELRGKVGKADNGFSLQHDALSVIFYSDQLQKGVVYDYAEAYEGAGSFKNSIWDRKRDNKLYFMPEVKSKYTLGERFEFLLQVIPFSATPEQWTERGKAIAAEQ